MKNVIKRILLALPAVLLCTVIIAVFASAALPGKIFVSYRSGQVSIETGRSIQGEIKEPALSAGVESGDVLVSINGDRTVWMSDTTIRNLGEKLKIKGVTLGIWRFGESLEVVIPGSSG